MTDQEVPYDQLDPPVRALCRALNSFSGILTIGSCGGHLAEDAFRAENRWWVSFGLDVAEDGRPTYAAWLALEFIAWAFRDMWRGGYRVEIAPVSLPPYLNEPGQMLAFSIEGWRDTDGTGEGIEPDRVAQFLEEWNAASFRPYADELIAARSMGGG